MPQILVRFDEATLRAIDRIAPAAKRQRADFIRTAVKDALFQRETERMREAYLRQPDSAEEDDHWDAAESEPISTWQ
jgi:metal-responsive CopG/Arc/MetJ family transcriptional regulator